MFDFFDPRVAQSQSSMMRVIVLPGQIIVLFAKERGVDYQGLFMLKQRNAAFSSPRASRPASGVRVAIGEDPLRNQPFMIAGKWNQKTGEIRRGLGRFFTYPIVRSHPWAGEHG